MLGSQLEERIYVHCIVLHPGLQMAGEKSELEKIVYNHLLELHHILWMIDDPAEVESVIEEESDDDPSKINEHNLSAVQRATEEEKACAASEIGDWGCDFWRSSHVIREEKGWLPRRRKSQG